MFSSLLVVGLESSLLETDGGLGTHRSEAAMSFASRSGLNLMTRGQEGRQRPESRRPGARAREGDSLHCDVTGVAADVAAVDALARLALTLRRQGARLELCGASRELHALVKFMGLAEVLLNTEAPPE
jgi:hypothetical protein